MKARQRRVKLPEGTRFIRIVNWETFQHYKDRNPPWIKVYNTLLEDLAYAALPDAAKGHVIGIWLLASRLGNKIPAEAQFIGNRINAQSPVDLNLLYSMGFIEPLAECEQNASKPLATCYTETERETEQSRERDRADVTGAKSLGIPDADRPAYADAVWQEFLRVSEAKGTRLMAPGEFNVLKGWMDSGVPLRIVLRGISDTRGKGSSLGYYGPSVKRAIEAWAQALPQAVSA